MKIYKRFLVGERTEDAEFPDEYVIYYVDFPKPDDETHYVGDTEVLNYYKAHRAQCGPVFSMTDPSKPESPWVYGYEGEWEDYSK